MARTEFPRAMNEDLVPDPSCVPHDIRARRAPQKVVYWERVFSWFPPGDQVKKNTPLRCAPHVWKVPENENPEHQDQQANSTTPHRARFLGRRPGCFLCGGKPQLAYAESPRSSCGKETRNEQSAKLASPQLRKKCGVDEKLREGAEEVFSVGPSASTTVPMT